MSAAVDDTLKLWEVANGWIGCSYVRCLVIARDVNEAKRLGLESFERYARRKGLVGGVGDGLRASLLCSDLSKPWARDCDDEGHGDF